MGGDVRLPGRQQQRALRTFRVSPCSTNPSSDPSRTVHALPTRRDAIAIGGGSADTIVAARPKEELLVFTSDPVHRVMMETYGAALAAVVQSYVYMAAIVRFPTAFCWVSGLNAPAIRGPRK